MTRTATRSVTPSSSRWPTGSGKRCGRSTSSPAMAARSSSSYSPKPERTGRSISPSASVSGSGRGRCTAPPVILPSRSRSASPSIPTMATARLHSCAPRTRRCTPPRTTAETAGAWRPLSHLIEPAPGTGEIIRVTHRSAPVTKAVIPAAGLGTRFLPATKATPKEMLPVVDKPAIQYVVEEAVRAGLSDVLMVTGRNKTPLEDHFDRNYELEDKLEGDAGKLELLERVRESSDLATVHYVRQKDPRGLGHAVLCAAQHVGHEPFAVLLGDDLIDERDPVLPQMIDVQKRHGGSVLLLLEVPHEQISLYGAAVAEPTDDEDIVRVRGTIEKPPAADAPSNLAVIGRYVLAPEIFDVLRETPPGRGGEIQLTDAINTLCGRDNQGGPVHGVVFRGRRYDTGDKGDYLRAIVQLAADRVDLGPAFREWLGEFAATRLPAGEAGEAIPT